MTTDPDATRALRSWLEDGPSPTDLPDTIFDAVMDRVPEIRQRRSAWPELRLPVLRMVAGVGMVAAVVVLAVWAVVNAPHSLDFTGVGPEPTSSDDPAEAAVRSTLRYWTGQTPPAGTYFIDDPFPMRIALTLPEEMEVLTVTSHLGGVCTPSCEFEKVTAGLDAWIVENAYVDACQQDAILDPPLGGTVEDFVDHLTGIDRISVTRNTEVTFAGYDGRYLEIETSGDLSDCAEGSLRLFYSNPGELFWRPAFTGNTDRLWVLDVEDVRLVIDLWSTADATAEQLASLHAVVESIRIEHVGEIPPRTN